MIRLISLTAVLCAAASLQPAKQRSFELSYTATVPVAKGAGTVRVWLPVPQTGWDQTVEDLKVTAPVPTRITTDPVYGNHILYLEVPDSSGPLTVGWSAKVTRREHADGGAALTAPEILQVKRLLADENKTVVHAKPVKTALAKATGDKHLGRDEKPRAIYDYVVSSMVYDKVAPGWGQGDTLRACSVGKGNCTDFHSLFISMNRLADIPAKFAIGFSIPKPPGGEVPGYHCWAYYLSGKNGWVPVDASEAFKHPELKEYYFGHLTADRVELTQGRDITLEPKQAGAPLNYFLNPYAEQGDKPVAGAEKKVSFRELN